MEQKLYICKYKIGKIEYLGYSFEQPEYVPNYPFDPNTNQRDEKPNGMRWEVNGKKVETNENFIYVLVKQLGLDIKPGECVVLNINIEKSTNYETI